jgi:hypothetical protein
VKSSGVNVGIAALPGQEIYEVEIPEVLTRLRSGHEFYAALSQGEFDRASGKMIFPEISVESKEE